MLKRHRDVARLSLGRIPVGPTLALLSEWLFELLRPVGIPDDVIGKLGDLMGLYVGAHTSRRASGWPPPRGRTFRRGDRRDAPELPPVAPRAERFPHTLSAVDALFEGGPDDRFEFALDLIIRGLEFDAGSERFVG